MNKKNKKKLIKDLELVKKFKNFKKNHIYYEIDKYGVSLILIDEIRDDGIETTVLRDDDGDEPYDDEFGEDNVSSYHFYEGDFDDAREYSYYHVGKKSKHPEYFLWLFMNAK